MQGTGKGKHIGQDEYNRIKELLKTRSPLELSQAGVCGYSTAYKILSTTGYGDYRNKLREDREKFYLKRKAQSATPIKKNVPPLGNGSIRFTPPKKPMDGTGRTDTIFGSPFRENVQHVPKEKPQNGPVVVVRAGTQQPEAEIIDVKSGSAPAYKPAENPIILPYPQDVYDANEARNYNAKISVNNEGLDAFKYVDVDKLAITRGKRPQPFSKACIAGVCSLARNGGTPSEIRKYLVSAGYGNKSIDQIARTMAYDEEGLKEFKKAWKDGETEREKRREKEVQDSIANARRVRAENRNAVERAKVEPVVVPTPSQQLTEAIADPKVDKIYLTAEPSPAEEAVEKAYEMEIEERKPVVTAEHVKEAADRVALKQAEEVMKKKVQVIKVDGDKLDPEVVIDRAYRAKNGKLVKKVKIKRKHMSYDTIFLLGAQATVLALKLAGAIELNWVWTFLPIYILVGGVFLNCFLLGALTTAYFLDYVKENGGVEK